MEQVFKTKWVPDWQYVGMGVAILVVIVIFFWLQEWTALGGLIVPLMLFYSQSKTMCTIKVSGVLEGKSVWGKRFCVDGIRKITYQPHALGMQIIKVEQAQGFVMISPDRPLEFVEALKKVCPGLAVEGFELIKN